ncbi:hypothetical protein Tco_0187676, partial [Tanacetum coccineum]
MTKLTQKKVKFEWGDKQEASFGRCVDAERRFHRILRHFKEGFGRCVDAERKNALSRKEREPPLRVRALVMTISLDLPTQILNAKFPEAIREQKLEPRADGTL